MMGPPAFCDQCGNLFESCATNISNSRNITLVGNTESCPRCGGRATIAEGTFNFSHDDIEVLKGSAWTREQVKGLRSIYEKVRRQNTVTAEIVEELKAVSPALAQFAQRASTRRGGRMALLLFLAMVLVRQCHVDVNVDLDVNRLFDQAVVERSIGGGESPP